MTESPSEKALVCVDVATNVNAGTGSDRGTFELKRSRIPVSVLRILNYDVLV